MSKVIFALSIIVAFVVGSIMTASIADAAKKDDPLTSLWAAITELQSQISILESNPIPEQCGDEILWARW